MTVATELINDKVKRVLVKEHIQRSMERAGFGGLTIQRTPLGTHIRVIAERPGLVIGRKGSEIQKLTRNLEEKFGYENLQIEANEVDKPALNAMIMAAKVASALERGWNYRRAGNSILQRIMDGGARGCQITIAGKLTGLRHRTEKFISGHIKHCGEVALQSMEIGHAQAKLKPGTIGVKVALMPPEAKLPDEITVVPPVKIEEVAEVNEEKPAEEVVAEEKPAEEVVAEEKPAEEVVAEEKPAEEVVAEEKPAEEVVAEEKPAEEEKKEKKS